MRRSPSNKTRRYSPTQALHTRFSPKMEIIGSKFPKSSIENKPEASSMLMLPKQGIFGTLNKGQPYPQQPIKIPQMRIHSSIIKKKCSY
jgi:hypothetical protein